MTLSHGSDTSLASIHATNLLISFNQQILFSADNLHFSQGDVIYLQGDNGSGKSTLMKLLAGLIKPNQGKITSQGFAPQTWWRPSSLLGKAVYLHQHPYLFEGSVKYNLTYALDQRALSPEQRKKRIKQAIHMAQLTDLLNHNASDLSGGERQRLAIARAWIAQPKLLMLDEPISNMDKHSQRLVLAMINQLKQDGTGLLISSHQTCGLTALCQQHWHIKQRTIHTSIHVPQTDDLHDTHTTELHYGTTN
ncbi:energy-coupling factor ABC transporter ATP-binding protein [Shewanella sp. SG41-4]|uniref:energy-coupling factor ABC transporter ATP-binding protein n=1 Tax=Shewanella sp. SG41-4 TaxID=2760976 RepID=UPI00160334E6|nr:energy-coupling factor ABC transporter ATP-binding protein [Shewanella sp. SG41-4]MBB1439825.1 energy-coupling factor ABC transporter ATP-binding protein [Shewanella sp. SG41-4]